MRKKENRLVITFSTTSEAMAMEELCKTNGYPGRMIPVPKEISSGCGLAWCVIPKDKEKLSAIMKECKVSYEGMHEVMMYV